MQAAGTLLEQALRAYALHVSIDMPASANVLNAIGRNGLQPDHFRAFNRVYLQSHAYYPPVNPISNEVLLAVRNCTTSRRTASTIARKVEEVEAARLAGKPWSRITLLSKHFGLQGYSMRVFPSFFNAGRWTRRQAR